MEPLRSVTMEDVAREAGVSRALVSIAFRGVPGVSEGTKQKILAVADRLGYRPNRIAARLASRSTTTIGVFLLELRNGVFADMLDGIRDVADANGKHLVLGVGEINGSRDAGTLDSLARSRVDVVIAAGLLLPDPEVARFAASIPLISAARLIPGVDSVGLDNHAGTRAALGHLLSLGHTRIAFLANPQTDGYRDRQEGYTQLMHDEGLQARVIPSAYSRALAARDIGPVLDSPDRPTAVVAHNDQAALGVLDALAYRGLAVPGDVSVVGYDNTEVGRSPGTELTTVDIHGYDLGREAGELALRRIAHPAEPPSRTLNLPTLIVRRTTGPAPR